MESVARRTGHYDQIDNSLVLLWNWVKQILRLFPSKLELPKMSLNDSATIKRWTAPGRFGLSLTLTYFHGTIISNCTLNCHGVLFPHQRNASVHIKEIQNQAKCKVREPGPMDTSPEPPYLRLREHCGRGGGRTVRARGWRTLLRPQSLPSTAARARAITDMPQRGRDHQASTLFKRQVRTADRGRQSTPGKTANAQS